jgi:hypothetical protein
VRAGATGRVIFGMPLAQPTNKAWMHFDFLPSAEAFAPGGVCHAGTLPRIYFG